MPHIDSPTWDPMNRRFAHLASFTLLLGTAPSKLSSSNKEKNKQREYPKTAEEASLVGASQRCSCHNATNCSTVADGNLCASRAQNPSRIPSISKYAQSLPRVAQYCHTVCQYDPICSQYYGLQHVATTSSSFWRSCRTASVDPAQLPARVAALGRSARVVPYGTGLGATFAAFRIPGSRRCGITGCLL